MGDRRQHSKIIWWHWSEAGWRVDVRLAARVVETREGVGREQMDAAIDELREKWKAEVREDRG